MATVQDYLNNAKWVRRISQMFTDTDVDKNGYVSVADFIKFVDNLAKEAPDRPDLITKLRAVMVEWAAAIGIKEGIKASKQEYLKLMAAMAVSENAKVKRGEKSLIYKLDNALFDVVDVNHDGNITLNEYKLVMKAFNLDEASSEAGFAAVDKNKNGRIERNEFIETEFKFWFSLDDPDAQGILGEKFE